MAYSLNSTGQYISAASTPVTAAPMTMYLLFKQPSSAAKNLFFLRAPANATLIGLYIDSSRVLHGYLQSPGGTSDFTASGNSTNGAWNSAVYVETSSTSRSVYLNAGSAGTDANSRTFSDVTTLDVGFISVGNTLGGDVAEVAIWSAALTVDEITSLNKGFKPSRIRPQSLVFYAPLIRDLNDIKGGLALTNNNSATVADHPRVY